MAEQLCSFLGEFILLSYIDLFSVLHWGTVLVQGSTLVYWMGWGERMRDSVCVCVSQSMSPSHLLYKGSLSGVQ